MVAVSIPTLKIPPWGQFVKRRGSHYNTFSELLASSAAGCDICFQFSRHGLESHTSYVPGTIPERVHGWYLLSTGGSEVVLTLEIPYTSGDVELAKQHSIEETRDSMMDTPTRTGAQDHHPMEDVNFTRYIQCTVKAMLTDYRGMINLGRWKVAVTDFNT